MVNGGLGSAVMALLAGAGMSKPVTCIGVPDEFLPFGSASDIQAAVGMDADSVVERALAVLGH